MTHAGMLKRAHAIQAPVGEKKNVKMYRAERACKNCGKSMTAYNPYNKCFSCFEKELWESIGGLGQ
jgi:hypothetical protein